MFKFLRRVSTSFLPRPDRPWREDATSNAPTIGRKRRFSITDDSEGDDFGSSKKARTEPLQLDGVDTSSKDGNQGLIEGESVKSVTQGVEGVDLKDTTDHDAPVQPEGIPLPDSPCGTPRPNEPITQPAEIPVETQDSAAADGDSIASSPPWEKVEETLGSAEAEGLHPASTIASAAEDVVPADSLSSEEAPEVEA